MRPFEQFRNNPMVQADIQRRGQQPLVQAPIEPTQDQFTELAKAGKITHMGGTLPDFLKGIVTEAKDVATNVLNRGKSFEVVNEAKAKTFDANLAVDSLMGHESRGTMTPSTTVATETGAAGASQITPVMLDQYNKITGDELTTDSLLGNDTLQRDVTSTLVNYLVDKYKDGLEQDWPTKTPRLKAYKEEIKSKFNEPIYWVAGEWVAGPNWVAKLDNPTATGATETVRDYIQRIGDLYNGRANNVTLNK